MEEKKEKNWQTTFAKIVEVSVLLGFITTLTAGQDSIWTNVAIGLIVSILLVWGATLALTTKKPDKHQEQN